jgi:hypothetical protein
MRTDEFRGRDFIYGEIVNTGFLPATRLILHGRKPESYSGRVVVMHKDTVKRLRHFHAWKRGRILMGLYYDRPEK